MDHHCPWLNGCIGFFNRKFFMMLLMYAWLFAFITVAGSVPHLLQIHKNIDYEHWKPKSSFRPVRDLLFLALFGLCCGFLYIITTFYWFHLKLVFTNTTTIEHLESERNPEKQENLYKYDVGSYYNFTQVYGQKKLLWFFPITAESGNPVGDGIVFAQRDTQQPLAGHST